jgi:hypothetical protein
MAAKVITTSMAILSFLGVTKVFNIVITVASGVTASSQPWSERGSSKLNAELGRGSALPVRLIVSAIVVNVCGYDAEAWRKDGRAGVMQKSNISPGR